MKLKKTDGVLNTNTIGKYTEFNFKFSDLTLKLLTKHIQTAENSRKYRKVKDSDQDDHHDDDSKSEDR